jgi:hypothetical protein
MKLRLVDSNKGVQRAMIVVMGVIVEALGPAAVKITKKILPLQLDNLSDKNTLVRAETVAVMEKWAEQVGTPIVIQYSLAKLA